MTMYARTYLRLFSGKQLVLWILLILVHALVSLLIAYTQYLALPL